MQSCRTICGARYLESGSLAVLLLVLLPMTSSDNNQAQQYQQAAALQPAAQQKTAAPCKPGQFIKRLSRRPWLQCVPCGRDTYSAAGNTSFCRRCPAPFASTAGAANCTLCRPGGVSRRPVSCTAASCITHTLTLACGVVLVCCRLWHPQLHTLP
jgi:hypothetical protein